MLQKVVSSKDESEAMYSPSSGRRELPIDFGEFVAALRRNALTIILTFCVCWGAALFIISIMPREYTSSTLITLEAQGRRKTAAANEVAQIVLDSAQADSRMQVIKSERLLRYVFATLNLEETNPAPAGGFNLLKWASQFYSSREPLSPDQLRTEALLAFVDQVNVRRMGLSYVIEISVRARSPEMATHLANSIAMAYLRDTLNTNFRDGELLQRRVADIVQEESILVSGIKSGVVPDAEFPDADARIIAAAVEPLKPSSPQKSLIILAATVIGAFMTLGSLLLQGGARQPLKSLRQIRRRFDLQYVIDLPKSRRPSSRYISLGEPQIRAIGSVLKPLMSVDNASTHKIVAFVTCGLEDSASTVACGFAAALRRSGQTPVLIDGDLERSVLTQSFGLKGQRGLMQALRLDADHARPQYPIDDCVLIPSGVSTPGVTRPFLGHAKMGELLQEFVRTGPVLVTLPSVSQSADALHIGAFIEGVVVVVRANCTTVGNLRETLDAFAAWDVKVLATVLSREPRAAPAAVAQRVSDVPEKRAETVSDMAGMKVQKGQAVVH